MKRKNIKEALMALSIGLISLAFVFQAAAGTHSLSKWDSGKFDLVVSLGWTPSQTDRTDLEEIFELFAQDVWKMTEGNHEIRRLYVYTPDPTTNKARDYSKADIQFLKSANGDAANATIAGFKKAGRIFVDDDWGWASGGGKTEVGHALAHELGHYAYAVYDEYKSTNVAWQALSGFPHKDDTTKNAIMNNHRTWQTMSIPADYTDATKRETAQYRQYGESCWETMISPVANDSLWGALGYLGYKNTRFAFTDIQALNAVPAITSPTNNPAVDIIWMGGSEACVIIDKSGSMGSDNKMTSAISGAKSYLDRLKVDEDYAAVVSFDSSVSTIGALSLLTAAKITEFKNAIDNLSAGGGTSIGAALSSGRQILVASPRKGSFKYIVLLTDGISGDNATGSVLTDLANANIPVYAIGLGSDADMSTLNTIASRTNGKSYFAASASNLNAIYSDIQSVATDDKLNARIKDNLNVSKNSSSGNVYIDSSSSKAVFSASFPAGDTMELTLKMPNGTSVTPANVGSFGNIAFISEAGYTQYKVTSPDAGEWKMMLTATNFGGTGDSAISMEGKSDSDYAVELFISGGTYPAPILLAAMVSRDYPITGLDVTVDVTAPDGTESTLTLKDDGAVPDAVSGDGMYTGAIDTYENGSYSFIVTASNVSGNATETSKGVAPKQGTPSVSNPIGDDFEVAASSSIAASGVGAYSPGTDFANAEELPTDGILMSGRIEQDEQINYYYFNAVGGTSYTIYTDGLYPSAMQTHIKLYDSSQSLVTEDSFSMNNVSSKIVFTADVSDVYYVTVQHGSPGTGNYSVAARESNPTDGSASAPAPAPAPITGVDGGGGGGGGCFIATAACGSPMVTHVKVLRQFRDHFSLHNSVGKGFISLYYTYSPPIGDFIAKHDSFRAMVRISLLPVVGVSWIALKIGPVSTVALMLIFISCFVGLACFRRRYKE